MHFSWEDQTMQWMLEAAEYTGFYRNIAAMLLPYLKKRDTLCDIGCGMALTDMALAPELGHITCVDQNGQVLDFDRAEAAQRGIENLSFRCSDGLRVIGRWDTVMAMFHGRADVVCIPYLSMAADRLLLVTHGANVHHAAAFCENATEAAAWLDANGWTYTRQDAVLEFGQPSRSPEAAVECALTFHRGQSTETVRADVLERLQETGREDFPYYLPKTRSFAIFDIPRADNEEKLKLTLRQSAAGQ